MDDTSSKYVHFQDFRDSATEIYNSTYDFNGISYRNAHDYGLI